MMWRRAAWWCALLSGARLAAAGDAPPPDAPPPDAPAAPAADSHWPALVGAQYTYVLQHQGSLTSPYSGPLSVLPGGDTQASHTFGFYAGWAITDWAQYYFDTEKFMGAGVAMPPGSAASPTATSCARARTTCRSASTWRATTCA